MKRLHCLRLLTSVLNDAVQCSLKTNVPTFMTFEFRQLNLVRRKDWNLRVLIFEPNYTVTAASMINDTRR